MRFIYQSILSRIQEERCKADKADRRVNTVYLTNDELIELCSDVNVQIMLRPDHGSSFENAVRNGEGPMLLGISVRLEK